MSVPQTLATLLIVTSLLSCRRPRPRFSRSRAVCNACYRRPNQTLSKQLSQLRPNNPTSRLLNDLAVETAKSAAIMLRISR